MYSWTTLHRNVHKTADKFPAEYAVVEEDERSGTITVHAKPSTSLVQSVSRDLLFRIVHDDQSETATITATNEKGMVESFNEVARNMEAIQIFTNVLEQAKSGTLDDNVNRINRQAANTAMQWTVLHFIYMAAGAALLIWGLKTFLSN